MIFLDRIGLKNVEDIRTVGSTILQTLESELNQTTSSFNILTGGSRIYGIFLFEKKFLDNETRLRTCTNNTTQVFK